MPAKELPQRERPFNGSSTVEIGPKVAPERECLVSRNVVDEGQLRNAPALKFPLRFVLELIRDLEMQLRLHRALHDPRSCT